MLKQLRIFLNSADKANIIIDKLYLNLCRIRRQIPLESLV